MSNLKTRLDKLAGQVPPQPKLFVVWEEGEGYRRLDKPHGSTPITEAEYQALCAAHDVTLIRIVHEPAPLEQHAQ